MKATDFLSHDHAVKNYNEISDETVVVDLYGEIGQNSIRPQGTQGDQIKFNPGGNNQDPQTLNLLMVEQSRLEISL